MAEARPNKAGALRGRLGASRGGLRKSHGKPQWGSATAHHRRAGARRLGARRRDRLSLPFRGLSFRPVRCRARRRIAGWFGVDNPAEQIIGGLGDNLPPAIADSLQPELERLFSTASNGLLWTGALLALWAATGGTNALVKGITAPTTCPNSSPSCSLCGRDRLTRACGVRRHRPPSSPSSAAR